LEISKSSRLDATTVEIAGARASSRKELLVA